MPVVKGVIPAASIRTLCGYTGAMEAVAFYGAGLLGSNFVKALRRRGLGVHVWNRTHDKARALEADGARAFADPAEAARGVDRIHICVSDDAAVDSLLERILAVLDKRTIIVDHTTVSPQGVVARAKRLADAGYTFLHAPVFMGPPNALDGSGVMMCSGSRETVDRVHDALAAMTGSLKYLGERVDLAAIYKLMGNAMILAVIGGLNDVYRIAEEQGVPRQTAIDLFSFFNVAGQIAGRGKRMADADYDATWTMDMAHKDATLMHVAANEAPLPVIDAVERVLKEAIARGLSSKDLGAIAAVR